MSKYLYAIIKNGKREYKAVPGKFVRYDRLDAEPGDSVEFDQISQVVNSDRVINGEPLVEGARVRAHVVKHEKEKGIIVFRLKRRMLFHRKSNHRLTFTRIKIDEIVVGDEVFNKSNSNPRKIRQASAAARRAAVAKQPDSPNSKPEIRPVQTEPASSVVEKNSRPVQTEPASPVGEKNTSSVQIESTTPVAEKNTETVDKPYFVTPQANTPQESIQVNRTWLLIIAVLLLLLGFLVYVWNSEPSLPMQDEQVTVETPQPDDVDLRKTSPVDNLNTPAQPPD